MGRYSNGRTPARGPIAQIARGPAGPIAFRVGFCVALIEDRRRQLERPLLEVSPFRSLLRLTKTLLPSFSQPS